MKFEKRKRFSREEFAGLLADFARTITEENRIVFEDMEVSLPDYFEVELEYKEKKGYAKFEVEVFWDIEKTLSPSPYPSPARGEGITQNETIPTRFKEIKRGMERKLADIEHVLSTGNMPSEEDLNSFMKLTQGFWQQSEPDWIPSMNEMQTAIDSMIHAVKTGELPLALERIKEINNIKHRSHSIFK